MISKGMIVIDGKINSKLKQFCTTNNLGLGNVFDFDYNLIISSIIDFDNRLLKYGFDYLDKWQIVAPLRPYKELICNFISDEFHDYLKNKILDLRVPVYDDRVIFIKTCNETRKFWDIYIKESKYLKNSKIAFSLALWEVKPFILTLPVGWVK